MIGQLLFQYVASFFVSPTRPVTVPLSDGDVLKISYIPGLAEEFATSTDAEVTKAFLVQQDHPFWSVADGVQANWDVAGTSLDKCPICWPTFGYVLCPGYVWNNRGASPHRREGVSASRIQPPGAVPMVQRDEAYIVLPFLCLHGLQAFPHMLIGARSMQRFMFMDRDRMVKAEDLCDEDQDPVSVHLPGCRREIEPVSLGALDRDSFGRFLADRGVWKRDEYHKYVGCVYCHPTELHYIHPKVWTGDHDFADYLPGYKWLRSCWLLNAWVFAQGLAGKVVHITAWTRDYAPIQAMAYFGLPTAVFVQDAEDYRAVAETGRHPIWTDTPIGGRFLANLRVWAAAGLPVGTVGYVTNAVFNSIFLIDLTIPVRSPVEVTGENALLGVVHSALIVGGATGLGVGAPLTRMAAFGEQYGLEEAALARTTPIVHRMDPRMLAPGAEWNLRPRVQRHYPLVVRSTISERWAKMTRKDRVTTLIGLRMLKATAIGVLTGTSWVSAASRPLGTRDGSRIAPVLPRPIPPVVTVSQPTTLSGQIAREVGRVNWVVFGSHGDVVPVRALATRMAQWGIDIHVINPLTPAQAASVLASAEEGRIFDSAREYARVFIMVAGLNTVVFAPPEFLGASIGVSLRPPLDIIHPVTFGAGALVDYLLNVVLRGWMPIFNIGAYRRALWLPRSADGSTFLRTIRGGVRPVDVMVAWGSSQMPRYNIPGAVDVPNGDHQAAFATARVVVTHGGAGTVQTAAASGARVVVGTEVLDRRYRNRSSAGDGVETGVDPDSVMLMLLPLCPKVWWWAWKHSWPMFFRALSWGFRTMIGPGLWVFFAMFVKGTVLLLKMPTVRLVFTTSVSGTIVASMLSGYIHHSVTVWLAPQLVSLIDYVLASAGINYTGALLTFVQFLGAMSYSPLTWLLILIGHPWLAFPVHYMAATARVGSVLFAQVLAIVVIRSDNTDPSNQVRIGIDWAFHDSRAPIFHTRFIRGDFTEVLEGTWVSRTTGMGALYTLRRSALDPKDVPEWTFPTALTWADITAGPFIMAPYNALWNCQSAMLHLVRGNWAALGLGVVVLFPMAIWTWAVMLGSVVVFGVVALLVDFVPVLQIATMWGTDPGQIDMLNATAHHYLQALQALPGDWYGNAMALVVGGATGWGSNPRQMLHEYYSWRDMLRAQTMEEMQAVVLRGGTLSQLGQDVFREKMHILQEQHRTGAREEDLSSLT